MRDCLVKQLKAVINNDSLKKFGELRLEIKAKGAYDFSIRANNNVMRVESGTRNSILVDGNSVNLPWTFVKGTGVDGTATFTVNDDYTNNDFEFVQMKDLKSISLTGTELSSVLIKGLENIVSAENLLGITIEKARVEDTDGIHIEWFKNLQYIKSIAFVAAKICGNIADIPLSCERFNNSGNIEGRNPDLVGDIVDTFGNRLNINYIGLQGCNCTGDIADLADAQVSAGRTSGQIRILCNNSPMITNSAPSSTKQDGRLYFTTDTTTYPRGWYWTE